MDTKKSNPSQFDVTDYDFPSFVKEGLMDGKVRDYDIKELDKRLIEQPWEEKKRLIIEKEMAQDCGFKISPIVKKLRGIKAVEESEFEARVEEEVVRRLALVASQAKNEGFEKGREEGNKEIHEEMQSKVNEEIDRVQDMVTRLLESEHNIFLEQKNEIVNLLSNLSKWVILRELNEDGEYLTRLSEKMILELKTKANLIIRVSEAHFKEFPEVLEEVQKRIGKLTNVRLEALKETEGAGLIIESENGILVGTQEEQLLKIEQLFSKSLEKID